jgi:truncated hemoglobin YjbI
MVLHRWALICVVGGMLVGCKGTGKAPATKPVADMNAMGMANSLYGRLGGEKAIEAVVEEFVARASTDPRVNFTRKETGHEWEATADNVARLKVHLVQYFMGVTGGPPSEYRGKDMRAVHKGMKISNAEFDAAAEDLKASLDELNVPVKERDELMAIVGGTRGEIVEQR